MTPINTVQRHVARNQVLQEINNRGTAGGPADFVFAQTLLEEYAGTFFFQKQHKILSIIETTTT